MKRNTLIVLLLGLSASPALAQPSECERQFEAGDAPAALQACTTAVEANPDDIRAWTLRGLVVLAGTEPLKALQDFDRALGVDPEYLPALEARAQFHYARGDMEAASADLHRALAVEPGNVSRLIAMSNVRLKAGNKDEARDYLERAGKADKHNAQPWLQLAQLVGRDAPREQLAYLNRAVKADRKSPGALFWRAEHYNAQSEYKKATKDLRAAVKLAPTELELYRALASVLLSAKNPHEALKVIGSAMALQAPDPTLLMLQVRAQLDSGQPMAALHTQRWMAEINHHAGAQAAALIMPVIHARYAPDSEAGKTALAELKIPALDCDETPSMSRMMDALRETGGDRAKARQSLTRQLQKRHSACAAQAQPPSTERFAEVRRLITDAAARAHALSQQLLADCAPYASPRLDCDALTQEVAFVADQNMTELRTLEQQASELRVAILQGQQEQGARLQDIVTESDRELQQRASEQFAVYVDTDERNEALQYVRGLNWRDVNTVCPAPPRRNSDYDAAGAALTNFNRASQQYSDCLNKFGDELSDMSDLTYSAFTLQNQRATVEALRDYRCSRQSSPGCVPDAAWTQAKNALAERTVDNAIRWDAQRDTLLDTGIAQLAADRSAYIDSINRYRDQQEAEYQRQQNARAFSEAAKSIADSISNTQRNKPYFPP